MSDAPETRPARSLASAYFLGAVFVAVVMVLWLRGLGRLVVPALLVGVVVYGVYRFLRLLRAPVD